MKTKVLLFFSLLLGLTAFAQQETKKEPTSPKKINQSLGVCLMGKTMQCNGVTMSYIACEQGKLGFGFGVEYNREYMLGTTPLGIVTGIRLEYCRPYAKFEEEGQTLEVKAHDLTGVLPVMLQYHDRLGSQTELQLFTGPSLDLVAFRQGNAAIGGMNSGGGFIFGSPLQGSKPAWHWIGLSWNYGIGIQHNDIIFRLSSALGLLNHFDKDITANYIGYPLHINHPIIGTIMFKL